MYISHCIFGRITAMRLGSIGFGWPPVTLIYGSHTDR